MFNKIKKKHISFLFFFYLLVIFNCTALSIFNFSVPANNNLLINIFSTNETIEDPYDEYNLLSNVDDFGEST